MDDRFPTIAQALHDRGYRTGGFVANTFWLGRGFGIDRGFEWYQDYAEISVATVLDSWWLSQQVRRTIRLRRGDYRMTDRLTAADIRGRFLSWIDRDDRRPFFAFLNVFDAHEPYYPPGDFGFPFARRAAPVYHWNFNRAVAHAPEELTDLRDSYDSCIRYLDAQLEALVKALDTRGLMRNTIIIVTADHGETIGDHENTLIGHENSVYFDVLQVPLVIYVPSRTGGTRVNAPVSLADVPHTIVDLVSGSRARNPFPGRTVVPSDAQKHARRAGGRHGSHAPHRFPSQPGQVPPEHPPVADSRRPALLRRGGPLALRGRCQGARAAVRPGE